MVNRQTAVLSRAQARNLRKAAADIDIWRGGLERVFGRNEFNFYHPLYFLHYLDKAGFLEFNPYAGKRIVPHHPNVQDFSKQQHPYHVNQVVEVKFNPGFVPAIKKTKATTKEAKIRFPKRFSYGEWNCADVSWEYHCPWYAAETVGANGELIPHTGIDLYGHVGDGESVPIIALVRGRIWAMTTSKGDYEQSYGRVMLIKGDNDYLYLLGHLENFNDPMENSIRWGILSPLGMWWHMPGQQATHRESTCTWKSSSVRLAWILIKTEPRCLTYHTTSCMKMMEGQKGRQEPF